MTNSQLFKLIERAQKYKDPILTAGIKQLVAERHYLLNTVKIDPLTGLYNRRILDQIRDYSVIVMCDIDDFKTINDTFGHAIGDEVIKKISQVLLKNVRHCDYVCRTGGDEFLIVFTGNCDENIVCQRIENIRTTVTESFNLPDYKVTMSFGVAANKSSNSDDMESINNSKIPLESLLRNADDALYESKNFGKNKVSTYHK